MTGRPANEVSIELIEGKRYPISISYGYRAVPYGIRAKISGDGGRTWSGEIQLRDGAREYDIGYTRTVQRTDGKIVTVYYFTTDERNEQYIEATIWDPDDLVYPGTG
jgi:hypothetical protein